MPSLWTRFWLTFAAATWISLQAAAAEARLLNVSFDVSREFYQAYNPAFAAHWKASKGRDVSIDQSHAGSSKQARAVIDGLEADVVTFNQVLDMDAVAAKGLVASDWRKRFPHDGSPFVSTIVFLVRKGNPKGIRDWNDLLKPGVSVIIPNPKTSGNGRYSYLAAYAHALRQPGGTQATAETFVASLFRKTPVLDAGGRGATTTFVQRGIGDVLLTFEAEVGLTLKEAGGDGLELVVPSFSIEAELPVAVVEPVARRHGTLDVAEGYLAYLYSDAGQEIAAAHFYRPRSKAIATKYGNRFPAIALFKVEEIFGSWAQAQKEHFSEGGVFDRIYTPSK